MTIQNEDGVTFDGDTGEVYNDLKEAVSLVEANERIAKLTKKNKELLAEIEKLKSADTSSPLSFVESSTKICATCGVSNEHENRQWCSHNRADPRDKSTRGCWQPKPIRTKWHNCTTCGYDRCTHDRQDAQNVCTCWKGKE